MVPSRVLRILLCGSWEQSTALLWLLSSLKENHLGSRPIKTVSKTVRDQRWEVISEDDRHAWVIHGPGAALALIRGLPISTPGPCQMHCAASFAPSLKVAWNTKASLSTSYLHQELVSRCLFMGSPQIGKTHLFLYLSGFILEEVGRRDPALSWNMSPDRRQWSGWHCVAGRLGVGSAWRNLTTDGSGGSWPKYLLLPYVLGWG